MHNDCSAVFNETSLLMSFRILCITCINEFGNSGDNQSRKRNYDHFRVVKFNNVFTIYIDITIYLYD